MPLYDYHCQRCGDFRAFRAMKDADASQACPHCDEACERRLTAPMLGGGQPWLGQPRGGAGRGGWRAACGLGCSHASCAR